MHQIFNNPTKTHKTKIGRKPRTKPAWQLDPIFLGLIIDLGGIHLNGKEAEQLLGTDLEVNKCSSGAASKDEP